MNVLVVGCGAVGSLFASKLLLAGHEVVVVDRPEKVNQIRTTGLRLQERGVLKTARPAGAVGNLAEAFPTGVEYELIILATKAYDAAALLQLLPTAQFPMPRQLMTVQNGVESEPLAAQAIGPERVLAASLTTPISSAAAGQVTVEHSGRGLGLAPVAKGEDVSEWVALFQQADLTTKAYQDYQSMKWSKLFLNLAANATCAILNRRPAVIYSYWPTFLLERAMLREALAVIKGLGLQVVDLPGSPARNLARGVRLVPKVILQSILQSRMARGRGDKMPSLYLDLSAGRKKSEVVYLNGAVVKTGRDLGIETPVNYVLTDTLFKLATGRLLWDDFRGQPKALLARVKAAQEGVVDQ